MRPRKENMYAPMRGKRGRCFIAHHLHVVSLVFYAIGPFLPYPKCSSTLWYTCAKMNFNIIIAKVFVRARARVYDMLYRPYTSYAAHASSQPFDRSLLFFTLSRLVLHVFHLLLARSYEIFHHLLYRTEYFIFKSKFCSNLSKRAALRAHQLYVCVCCARCWIISKHKTLKSSDIFIYEAEGVGIAPFLGGEFRLDWTDINYVKHKRKEEETGKRC